MKRLFTIVIMAVVAFVASSCYDDTALRESIGDHEGRIKALETLCEEINTSLESLQNLVDAIGKGDYITDVSVISEDGVEVGYKITFFSHGSVTIYHGKNGASSENAPSIGVKQDNDGIYYWTVGGEWVLDDAGNKISATPAEGAAGITPEIKTEDGMWYVSYDNGATWNELGEVNAGDACVFAEVSLNDGAVVLELADGSIITVPVGAPFKIVFGELPSSPLIPGVETRIPYTIEGLTSGLSLMALSEMSLSVEIEEISETEGNLVIVQDYAFDKEVSGKVVLFAANEVGTTVAKAVEVTSGVLYMISDTWIISVGAAASQIELKIAANADYEVSTTADWITLVETKAVEEKALVFDVQANSGQARQAWIEVKMGNCFFTYNVEQAAYDVKFEVEYAWDVNASYMMDVLNFEELVNPDGLTLASALGYGSWDEVISAIGDYDTRRNFAGEVVVTPYDVYSGYDMGIVGYTSNDVGYWMNADGYPTSWGLEETRVYWEYFVDENSCTVGAFPGHVYQGDVYRYGILFTSPYGQAKIEVTVVIHEFVDTEEGLYPEVPTPGEFDITIDTTIDIAKLEYDYDGVRVDEYLNEVKEWLGMTSYELYNTLSGGYHYDADNVFHGIRLDVILPDGSIIEGQNYVWLNSSNLPTYWGADDAAIVLEWAWGMRVEDYFFNTLLYPKYNDDNTSYTYDYDLIGKTYSITFRLTYCPEDSSEPTVINMHFNVYVTDSSM